jgi:DNA polymerase III delta prime subunit
MNNIDLLILDGPPAVGKSSLANAIAYELRRNEIRHAIIEMDELARIYPLSLVGIMYKSLASVWPNYEALGEIKIIIPTYMQLGELEIITGSAPAKRVSICEVVAPYSESAKRISEREANEATRRRLLAYLDNYPNNRTPEEHIDFTVANFNRPIDQAAQEVINKLEWL